jgi:2-polyprenyl-3-methyl-5-hydroxy-6-metoxy-1,4-benzoquinol methylase
MTNSTIQNPTKTFYQSAYKEIWKHVFPKKITIAEIAYLEQATGLKPGDRILDLMCGYGRHSIELARKGFIVTAVDSLSDYVQEIKQNVKDENLFLQIIEADVLQLKLDEEFDLVICMGNSLSIFNYYDTLKIFEKVHSVLKPGGKFIFHSLMITEVVIKNFQEKSWHYVGDYRLLTDSKYLLRPTRIENELIMINKEGKTEEQKLVEYVFSFAEIEEMLNLSGFSITEIYGIPGKKSYSFGDPRVYIEAVKN